MLPKGYSSESCRSAVKRIAAGNPDSILYYGQTYHTQGWTVQAGGDGTRFTNDGTGHGMFVSIENVYSF